MSRCLREKLHRKDHWVFHVCTINKSSNSILCIDFIWVLFKPLFVGSDLSCSLAIIFIDRVRIDPKHIRKTIYAKTGNTFAASVIVSGLE